MRFLTFTFLSFFFSAGLSAQGAIEWNRSYGGSGSDVVVASIATTDGGFLMGAISESLDGNVTGNHGGPDVWLVKTNSSGEMLWQKCLGDLASDGVAGLVELTDGGFAILGSTRSDGVPGVNQVHGNHGSQDFWLVRVNETGDFLWSQCYGGELQEDARGILQKSDGSLVLIGNTLSFDMVDSSGVYGGWNGYILGVSATDGAILWERVIGGTGSDYLYAGLETPQGNLTLTGVSGSINGALSNTTNHGLEDLWVCQINPDGDLLWNHQYGGSQNDGARAMCQTANGGYLLTGNTRSVDGNLSGNNGLLDAWVLYLSENGGLIWSRSLGGSENETGFSIFQSSENDFIWGGETVSVDGDILGNHGGRDVLMVKMDFEGNILKLNCFGGSGNDFTRVVLPVGALDVFIAGTAASSDGDLSQNFGNFDAWFVKFGYFVGVTPDPTVIKFDLSPNPAKDHLTISTDLSGRKTWLVYDTHGALIQTVDTEEAHLLLPVQAYPAGVYFVKQVSSDGTEVVKSFIKN